MKVIHPTVVSAWVYLVVSILITALKFAAFAMTHSQAIFSDALESIVNVITAAIALIVMKYVVEPADEDHPYGHGKLEYFSAAFEGGMIAFAALAIAYEAIRVLIQGHQIREIEMGMVAVFVAAAINLLLSLRLKVVGKKHNSEALLASSAHVMSDVITTVGVIGGLILVKLTGWLWIDPAVAIIVAIQLAVSGYKIVRKSAGGLIDEVDKKSLNRLVLALNNHKKTGLIDVHNARIIRSGSFHHVDAHLVVPDFWDVLKVHTEAHNFEKNVVADYPFDGEFAFHVDPCQKEYCNICDLENCPIRVRKFVNLKTLTVESVINGPEKDKV